MAGPRLSAERCDYREKADEHRKVAAHRALLKGAAEHGPPYRPRRGRAGTRAQEGGQPKSRCPLECRLGLEMNIINRLCPPAAATSSARFACACPFTSPKSTSSRARSANNAPRST